MQPTASLLKPNNFLTVVIDGVSFTIRSSDSAFDKAVEAFNSQDWVALKTILSPAKAIADLTKNFGDIEVRDNAVFYKGETIHNVVVERILQFRDEGADMTPLVKFLAKLMRNPSSRAVNELYRFLEHENLPITTSGNFLAYKGLTADFWSITSGNVKLLKGHADVGGRIFNGVGEEIEIPRNQVDDNKDRTCSYGLHAGSLDYADGFRRGGNGKLVVVEIDPSDVVSIPSDCNGKKLRTCRYKVVGEFEGALDRASYESRFQKEGDEELDDQFVPELDEDDEDEIQFFDDQDELMVDGGVYIVGGDTLYRWDKSRSLLVSLHCDSDTYSFTENASYVDESLRETQNGPDLQNGELYRGEDENIYRWNATLDQFESVRPDDGSTLSYLQSLLWDMERVS